ncbi:hypothetical protein CW736_00870 [Nonlabens sp. MB-3u-79]|uniref:hypothetical protein n=1 Tax=Nonlabens sp. MB-3u-79 TaxID=2058134 RepID=UPI000C30FFD1|nr:hypothetical protein [Nonlabens sp. MB-3u-79]AUC78054.1 hypothetical protein CW736_00870 [Nonlabens sp. MB-3u-79]
MRHIIPLFLFAAVFISCKKDIKTGDNYSFYHWSTTYHPTEKTDQLIKDGGTYKEYVRFFDLVVDQRANSVFPIATIQFDEELQIIAQEIIPVVYIRNEVFLHKDAGRKNLNKLAKNTAEKIKRIQNKHLTGKVAVKQIQIDCDWTDRTKTNFFNFLRILKKEMPGYVISSTLRLHQVKFKERTGVPPVDRVVLMVYNVGDLGDVEEVNSIISNEVTAQYLEQLEDYPLPYDVALPLFEWGVLYRDGKLKGLIRDLTPSLMESAFAKAGKENSYKATSDSYINGIFIYKGDDLRVETVNKEKLQELSSLIKKASGSNADYETIFYHINSPLTLKFSSDELSSFAQ